MMMMMMMIIIIIIIIINDKNSKEIWYPTLYFTYLRNKNVHIQSTLFKGYMYILYLI